MMVIPMVGPKAVHLAENSGFWWASTKAVQRDAPSVDTKAQNSAGPKAVLKAVLKAPW